MYSAAHAPGLKKLMIEDVRRIEAKSCARENLRHPRPASSLKSRIVSDKIGGAVV